MSEATLHVIDAPRVKTANAAQRFIERWAERDDAAPNQRLRAFLEALHELFPDTDSASDGIWYERIAPESITGPVLPLVFRLARFDAQALATLRDTAGKHRLQVFDEEGGVLYLADGSEAGNTRADPLAALRSGERCSPEGLRYDGVFVAKLGAGWSYYRFAQDRRFYRLSVARRLSTSAAFADLVEGDTFVGHGKYRIDGDIVSGTLRQNNAGVFVVRARFTESTLSLSSVRKDGKFPYEAEYAFEALPPALYAEPGL